jgi:hypothetical protein
MKKLNLRGFLVLLIMFLIYTLISFAVSCAPDLSFGELTVCRGVDQKTYEPVNPKDEFDIGTEEIYVTIKYSGVKGEDNYRYKWVNLDTGENILDESNKYSEGNSDYFEGYAMSFISTNDEVKVIPPGNYKVEFYHNGESKSATDFMVKKPEVKISEVALANEAGENYEPINTTQQFSSTEVIYACVNVNYYISGNTLKAKWYDSNGNLVIETADDFDVDLFEPVWTAFTFKGEGRDIPAGAYQVEIYLNDNLYGTYDFEVGEARTAEDIFIQGNTYSNDKYSVSFAVPDNWTYTESDDADGLEVNLTAQSGDLPVIFLFMASPTSDYPPSDKFRDFADEISYDVADEHNWELVEVQENESITKKGIKYNDFIYLFKDPDNTEWALAISFSEGNGRLYMLFGTVMDDYFKVGESVYTGIMESLEL